MKTIKIKLTWDELNAMLHDMEANVDIVGSTYEYKLAMCVLMEWSIQQQPRLLFRKPKPFKITLKVSTAIAFVLFIHSKNRHASNFIDNTYIRINGEIQQQLA